MRNIIVIQSCGCADAPRYNGISSIHEFETIEDAKAHVKSIVENDYSEYIGFTMESGKGYGWDGTEYKGSLKHAPHAYYNELSAWCRGDEENWERIETFIRKVDGSFESL